MPVLRWLELGRQGCGKSCILGYLEHRMTFGSLSADGGGCVPVLLVVWPETSSTGACRLLGGARSCC